MKNLFYTSPKYLQNLKGIKSSASEIDGKVIPVDTIADLRAKTVSTETVWVSGYHTKNDGAFGSNIFRWNPTSTATDNGGTIIKLTSVTTGRYELQYSGAVNVKWFGAKGDGITDDTLAIQNTIDCVLRYFLSKEIYIPSGSYKTTDTLHLGYGAYHGLTLCGSGSRYKGETNTGTRIVPTFVDRPGIAITSARRTIVKGLSVKGMNSDYIYTNNLGLVYANFDDRDINSWKNPELTNMTDGRYNAYTGIAIDPYSGTKPSNGYPDVNYPSWTNITTQYNKAGSSQVRFEDVAINGFVIGVSVQTSNYDGNGDFITFDNCALTANLYGYSAGNSQARQLGIKDCLINTTHTAIVTTKFGKQVGKINGLISNTNFDACNLWLDVDASYGSLHLDGCYAESAYRIITDTNTSTNKNPIKFTSCEFSFSSSNEGLKGKTKHEIDVSGGTIILDSCVIRFDPATPLSNTTIPALSVNLGCDLVANNCKMSTSQLNINSSKAVAINMLQNSLIPSSGNVNNFCNNYRNYNVDTFVDQETYLRTTNIMGSTVPSRSITYPKMLNINTLNLSGQYSINETHVYISSNSWSNVVTSGLTTTVDIGTSDVSRCRYRVDLGDILQYRTTYYYVSNRAGSVLTLIALNDYEKDGTQNNPIPTTPSGDVVYFHSRKTTIPSGYEYYFSFTSGSNIANVRRGSDGYLGNIGGDFTIGDRIFITRELLGLFSVSDTQKITAIDSVNGTITFSSNARKTVSNAIVFVMSRTFAS